MGSVYINKSNENRFVEKIRQEKRFLEFLLRRTIPSLDQDYELLQTSNSLIENWTL